MPGQMSYQEAEAKMAELLKKAIDYHKECRERHGCDPDCYTPGELTEEEIREHNALRHDARKFADELAADPYFFDILESYMTDVVGTGGCPTDDAVKAGIESAVEKGEMFEFITKLGGNLADAIRRYIQGLGFRISDSGGGCGGWHYGVRGNEPDSRRLCAALHKQFKPAIDAGLIKIRRHHWGYRLPTLYNDNDVEAYFRDKDE